MAIAIITGASSGIGGEFARQLQGIENTQTVFFVTDSEDAFREMTASIGVQRTYQLYRDYLDNFVLGGRRDS